MRKASCESSNTVVGQTGLLPFVLAFPYTCAIQNKTSPHIFMNKASAPEQYLCKEILYLCRKYCEKLKNESCQANINTSDKVIVLVYLTCKYIGFPEHTQTSNVRNT